MPNNAKPPEGHGERGSRGHPKEIAPLPADAPLLCFDDAAAYLRTTSGALSKILDGTRDDRELGEALRACLVSLSPRRRFFAREPLLRWLKEQANVAQRFERRVGYHAGKAENRCEREGQ